MGGLNMKIADVMQLQPYLSLADLIQLAVKVEKQRAR